MNFDLLFSPCRPVGALTNPDLLRWFGKNSITDRGKVETLSSKSFLNLCQRKYTLLSPMEATVIHLKTNK